MAVAFYLSICRGKWDVTILRKPRMPVLQDPRKAVAEAFANPVNCPPLPELACHARSAAIAICDITRPVPSLAHAETITTFHNARVLADPFASNCNLEG